MPDLTPAACKKPFTCHCNTYVDTGDAMFFDNRNKGYNEPGKRICKPCADKINAAGNGPISPAASPIKPQDGQLKRLRLEFDTFVTRANKQIADLTDEVSSLKDRHDTRLRKLEHLTRNIIDR